MSEWLADSNLWASLLTQIFLEIVLGVGNIIFLSIIADRVAEHRRLLARQPGLALALFGRIALLGVALVADALHFHHPRATSTSPSPSRGWSNC
jgi:predicted tellurium resistance membrane protein TerC